MGVFSAVPPFHNRHCLKLSTNGGFMSLHFQVYADFMLTNGKPQLASTSIFSTHAACTSWPIMPYENSCLTISRIFHTLKNAQDYIAFLHGVYPHSPAPPPVLDSGQKDLILEVSK
jgi:hypothetical protein